MVFVPVKDVIIFGFLDEIFMRQFWERNKNIKYSNESYWGVLSYSILKYSFLNCACKCYLDRGGRDVGRGFLNMLNIKM